MNSLMMGSAETDAVATAQHASAWNTRRSGTMRAIRIYTIEPPPSPDAIHNGRSSRDRHRRRRAAADVNRRTCRREEQPVSLSGACPVLRTAAGPGEFAAGPGPAGG